MPRWKVACATLALLLIRVGPARAESPPPPAGLPAAPVAPPPGPTATPPAQAAPAVPDGHPAGGSPCAAGDGTAFAVDLMLGQFLGFRGQAAVCRDADSAFVLEGFYGALLDRLASGEGAGGGARYYLHRTDRGGANSFLIGPGVGAYYHFHDRLWMLAPTLDLAWVRPITDIGSWELGLNAGLGISVSNGRDSNDVGRVTPLFSVFTGFRF